MDNCPISRPPRTYLGSWFAREIRTVGTYDSATASRLVRRYTDGTPVEPIDDDGD